MKMKNRSKFQSQSSMKYTGFASKEPQLTEAQKHFANIKQEWDSDTRKMIERRLLRDQKE